MAVTQDRFTDWSPVWSPDGRWLYFSSDRGGSMNLWRIPVGANGLPGGDAQPVTTGTQSMGWAAFSQDGRRLVAMAYDRTNDVAFYELARLQRGETDPLRRLKLQSSVWCALSPDAEWISCSTRGGHEDLVLLRSLIEKHYQYTGSPKGEWVLEHWTELLPKFVKVMPKEYKKVLQKPKEQPAIPAAIVALPAMATQDLHG